MMILQYTSCATFPRGNIRYDDLYNKRGFRLFLKYFFIKRGGKIHPRRISLAVALSSPAAIIKILPIPNDTE
jgi:hypothetical protein